MILKPLGTGCTTIQLRSVVEATRASRVSYKFTHDLISCDKLDDWEERALRQNT